MNHLVSNLATASLHTVDIQKYHHSFRNGQPNSHLSHDHPREDGNRAHNFLKMYIDKKHSNKRNVEIIHPNINTLTVYYLSSLKQMLHVGRLGELQRL